MAGEWGDRFKTFIIFLVITFFISILGFYVYNYFKGEGSISGALSIFIIAIVGISFTFLAIALGKEKLDSEVLLITIFSIAIAVGFFVYGPKYLGDFIGSIIGSMVPSNFANAFSIMGGP